MRGVCLVVVSLGVLACLCTSGSSEKRGDLSALEYSIDATFEALLGAEKAELNRESPLPVCEQAASGVRNENCRRPLKHEPSSVKELLPFLLDDSEGMSLWKSHFRRHVMEAVGNVDHFEGAKAPLHAPGLRPLAEGLFWESRPAVSQGALNHLHAKMEELRLLAEVSGTDVASAVTWEAEVSPRFKFHSLRDARKLMGTYLYSLPNHDKPAVPLAEPLPPKKPEGVAARRVDGDFDSREAFPECKAVIGHVRDQGDCGSCWAFASTEALNDRFCIKSNGQHRELLSPQHTTSCCDMLHCLSFGCNGGQPRLAWRWMANSGVVTGGDYSDLHTGKSCWPYEKPFCTHHSSGPYPECEKGPMKTPKCRKDCEEALYSADVHPFSEDLHFATKPFSIRGRDDIKQEIIQNGTLSSALLVFEDFMMYKSGVYHHVTGLPLGGHAVKVIGFGNKDGKDYWLCVNSWNEYWGDKGTFKIQMGEGGIDEEFNGGDAVVKEGSFRSEATKDL